MIRRRVRIENQLGLHARAAARLVKVVSRFQAKVLVGRIDAQDLADARSILAVLLLAAGPGTELQIVAEGSDETEAVESIVSLVQRKFGEEK